jgi:hypothetical protein
MNAAATRVPNRLFWPEPLRCLPLWALGLTKCGALRGGAKDVNPDERIVVGHELMAGSVAAMCRGFYPDLYALHETGEAGVACVGACTQSCTRCTKQR